MRRPFSWFWRPLYPTTLHCFGVSGEIHGTLEAQMPQLVTTIGTWYKSADRVLDVYRFQDRSPQLWLATPGYPGNTVHRTKKFVKLLSRPDTAPFVREFSPLGSRYTELVLSHCEKSAFRSQFHETQRS